MLKYFTVVLLLLSLSDASTLYQDDQGKFFVIDDKHIICSKQKTISQEPISNDLKELKKEIKDLRVMLKSLKKCQGLPTESQADTKEEKKNFFTLKGDLRTGYIYLKEDGSLSTRSKATGGNIGFTTKEIIPGVTADVSFYTIEGLGTNNTNDDFNIRAGDTTQSFGFIGESKITATFGDHRFRFGRQELDMPHDDSDHIRMLPNLFEAYRYGYKDFFHMGHIKTMAGWENNGIQTEFVNVHQVFEISDENNNSINKGISVIHFGDTIFNESFEYAVFNYMMHDALNLTYLEANYYAQLSENVKLTLAGQYDSYRSTDPFIMSNIAYSSFDSDVAGYKAALEISTVTVTLATNKASGTNAPVRSLGGGPYFTSMEDSTLDGIGTNDAVSNMLSIEYDATSITPGLNLAYFYGTFASDDKRINHAEQNFALEYEKEDTFTITMAYTLVSNEDSAITAGALDFTLFRAFLDIPLSN